MKYNSLCSYLIPFFLLQLQALNDNPKMQQNASLSQPIKTFELKANCTHLIVLRDEVADVTPAVPANAAQAPKMVKNPASVIKISVCDSVSVSTQHTNKHTRVSGNTQKLNLHQICYHTLYLSYCVFG